MPNDRLIGPDFDEPIISEPKTLEDTVIDHRRKKNFLYARGPSPGSTAVGPRKGEEKKLPPRRPIGNLLIF